jgi:hypothetical protein
VEHRAATTFLSTNPVLRNFLQLGSHHSGGLRFALDGFLVLHEHFENPLMSMASVIVALVGRIEL